MNQYEVTRAHLKKAYELAQWDLLDKLLSLDNSHINDASYFTDTWGEWWGLLLDAVYTDRLTAVQILISHGADTSLGNWGDCLPTTPKEAAVNKPAIMALLKNPDQASYQRISDPELPTDLTERQKRINQQGKIRDETGLIFPVDE